MSYDIELVHPVTGQTMLLDQPHQMKGGTYCWGGTRNAELNITYNYAKHYCRVLDAIHGIRIIYDMTGAQSIPILDRAIAALGDDVTSDYWEPTEGNAKAALIQLRTLASMRPNGIWKGD
jgi:hypothetical protein